MSAARPRVAVLGAGWWSTQAHLPALRDDPGVELIAIADPSAARLEAAAAAYGIERTYEDHRQLLERERPDAVIVAVPHVHHFEVARDALEAGASVLVEKPMTISPDHAAALVDLAATRRVHLMVGYTWHFNRQAQALRAALEAKRVGEIQLVSVLFASRAIEFYRGHPERYRPLFDYPVTGPDERSYSDPAIAGGGQGQLQVTHAAGLALWLTGLVPDEVSAWMARGDVEVDLIDAIAIRFRGGALGTLASTGNVGSAGRELLEYRIYGTDGAVVADFVGGTAYIQDGDGAIERLPDAAGDEIYPLYRPAQHLGALVRGEEENQAPGALGALVVSFLDAAYRSAARSAPVGVVSPTPTATGAGGGAPAPSHGNGGAIAV